jgi:hypothetical protein
MQDDTHDELVKAYLQYFKENEKFEANPSFRKYYNAKRCAKKIKLLAKKREDAIKEDFDNFIKERNNKNNR